MVKAVGARNVWARLVTALSVVAVEFISGLAWLGMVACVFER